MLIKETNPDLNKFLKHIKYYQTNKPKNNMIQPEHSDKDGLKWELKHNKVLTLIKNIKMFFIVCHLNKDNNFKNKLKLDLEDF